MLPAGGANPGYAASGSLVGRMQPRRRPLALHPSRRRRSSRGRSRRPCARAGRTGAIAVVDAIDESRGCTRHHRQRAASHRVLSLPTQSSPGRSRPPSALPWERAGRPEASASARCADRRLRHRRRLARTLSRHPRSSSPALSKPRTERRGQRGAQGARAATRPRKSFASRHLRRRERRLRLPPYRGSSRRYYEGAAQSSPAREKQPVTSEYRAAAALVRKRGEPFHLRSGASYVPRRWLVNSRPSWSLLPRCELSRPPRGEQRPGPGTAQQTRAVAYAFAATWTRGDVAAVGRPVAREPHFRWVSAGPPGGCTDRTEGIRPEHARCVHSGSPRAWRTADADLVQVQRKRRSQQTRVRPLRVSCGLPSTGCPFVVFETPRRARDVLLLDSCRLSSEARACE